MSRPITPESLVQRARGSWPHCAESFDLATLRAEPLHEVFRNKRNSRWRSVAYFQGVPRRVIRRMSKSPVRDLWLSVYVTGMRIGRSILRSLMYSWLDAGGAAE